MRNKYVWLVHSHNTNFKKTYFEKYLNVIVIPQRPVKKEKTLTNIL